MTYMSKILYANMSVKSFFKTSTLQPAAPKLLKVEFDILNLKNKNGPISFVFSGISFIFSMCFVSDENQNQNQMSLAIFHSEEYVGAQNKEKKHYIQMAKQLFEFLTTVT